MSQISERGGYQSGITRTSRTACASTTRLISPPIRGLEAHVFKHNRILKKLVKIRLFLEHHVATNGHDEGHGSVDLVLRPLLTRVTDARAVPSALGRFSPCIVGLEEGRVLIKKIQRAKGGAGSRSFLRWSRRSQTSRSRWPLEQHLVDVRVAVLGNTVAVGRSTSGEKLCFDCRAFGAGQKGLATVRTRHIACDGGEPDH
jgi:hypothetical protein